MSERTTMLRRYTLTPGTADEFLDWWAAHIPPLREAAGFAIDAAYLDREHETFTWMLSHPGDRAAFEAADSAYAADPARAAAIAIAPPLVDATIEFPERVR